MATSASLEEDTLHRVDFIEGTLPSEIASLYADLVDEYGVHDVLVLKRFGGGSEGVRDKLRREADIVEQPRVESLVRHAHRTIDQLDTPSYRLSSYERSFLFNRFLDQWEWDAPYLDNASEHDSFIRDVEQFSIVASWQGPPVTSDSVLSELTAAHNEFQDQLDGEDYLEHARVVHAAREALEDDTVNVPVPSTVIVLEAEDFTTAERAYVKKFTVGVQTHWVTVKQSAVQRTRNEAGEIQESDLGNDVETVVHSGADSGSLVDAVAARLATDRTVDVTDECEGVAVLNAATFAEQMRGVVEEIERIREEESLRYDDIAIVLKDNRSPIRGVIEALNSRGIPTASTTVSGLGDDPSVRELYTVSRVLAEPETVDDDAYVLLSARVGGDPPVDEIGSADSLVEGLWEWTRLTDLKRRIAENESEIDARAQFAHVSEVIELAEFVDRSSVIDATWAQFRDFLEFSFEHAAPDAYGDDIDSAEGGVLVDAAQRVKTGEWNTVFVVNAVDQEYPSDPRVNRLFPRAHLERIPEYPMVSAPTAEEVMKTFETATSVDTRPFRAYYSHYSRRLMAVAARAADKRLYFTTYRERRSDPGKYRRPSRFLVDLLAVFPQITEVVEGDIRTESRAVDHTLDSIDRTLDEIRRAPTADEQIDLAEIERNFGAIQRLLAESERGDEIAEAITARADFAEGVVRRE